jgi:hypothetical protein
MRNRCTKSLTMRLLLSTPLTVPMSSSVLLFVIPSRLCYVGCSLDGTLSDVTSDRHSNLEILLDQIQKTDHMQTTSTSAFVSLLSAMSSRSALIFSCLATFVHFAANVSTQDTSPAIHQDLNSLFPPLEQHEIDLQQAQRKLLRTLLLQQRAEAQARLRAQQESQTRMKANWRRFLNSQRHDKVCLLHPFSTLSEVLIALLCIGRPYRLRAASSIASSSIICVFNHSHHQRCKFRSHLHHLSHHRLRLT